MKLMIGRYGYGDVLRTHLRIQGCLAVRKFGGGIGEAFTPGGT